MKKINFSLKNIKIFSEVATAGVRGEDMVGGPDFMDDHTEDMEDTEDTDTECMVEVGFNGCLCLKKVNCSNQSEEQKFLMKRTQLIRFVR